jgi:hypothetical protein
VRSPELGGLAPRLLGRREVIPGCAEPTAVGRRRGRRGGRRAGEDYPLGSVYMRRMPARGSRAGSPRAPATARWRRPSGSASATHSRVCGSGRGEVRKRRSADRRATARSTPVPESSPPRRRTCTARSAPSTRCRRESSRRS